MVKMGTLIKIKLVFVSKTLRIMAKHIKSLGSRVQNFFAKISMRMPDAKTQAEYAQFQRISVVNKLHWLMMLLISEALLISGVFLTMRTEHIEKSEMYTNGSLFFLALLNGSMFWICFLTYMMPLSWPWLIDTLSGTLLTVLLLH